MLKNFKESERHEDLVDFEKSYTRRIDEFVSGNPETRIVFLNADFGWGKTTFIKANLKVLDNQIYSPWLNKSDNYIEDIYYHVFKKDKGLLSSISLFISFALMLVTLLSGSIISILMQLYTDNKYVCHIEKFKLICTTDDSLNVLLLGIIIVTTAIFFVTGIFIFLRPVPIINFFRRDNGKYYEDKIVKKISKKIKRVLVIEDIDRIDDIEEVLIAANKISEYMKREKKNKYILITGDYIRMLRRIGEPNSYENNNMNLEAYRSKGVFVVEKIISLRVDFASMQGRIKTLLVENNLKDDLTTIEYDEIVTFIKSKFLSIRFFIRFLNKYNEEIFEGNSIYHLLLKYYQEEKFFNIDSSIINNSIYNIERFPNCMNDLEFFLQRKKLKINNKLYKDFNFDDSKENNYSIINFAFKKIFFDRDNHVLEIFKQFYLNDYYPALDEDMAKRNSYSNTVSIGANLAHTNLKRDLDNYLIGFNSNDMGMYEGMLINKRCYFDSLNTSYNFENYKIDQVALFEVQRVSHEDFIYAYISCFLRKNKGEINKNYPKLTEIINEIIK